MPPLSKHAQLAQTRRARALALKSLTRDFVDAIDKAVGLEDVDHIVIDHHWLGAKMTDNSIWQICQWRED